MVINITGGGMFWIFVIIFFVVDTGLFLKGYNTAFWKHKTEAELQIQQIKIEEMKNGTEPSKAK